MSFPSSSIKDLDCILIQLTPELTIKKFNHEAESFYGCTQETVLGLNFIQFCHSVNVAPPLHDFSMILSGGSVEKSIQTLSINHFVTKLQWSITPLFDSENQAKITSILIVGIDADLRLDRENMARKEEYFKHIINNVPHSLFWKDKNLVFMGCNERFAKLAMLKSASEIVGKTDYDLPWSKQESDTYRADDQYVIQSKEAKLNIEESQTVNDKQIVLLTSKVPLYDNKGEVSGVLGIFTDITERKQKEAELQEAKEKAEIASKTKTEFLENMRHDIRTPLTGIVGFAELLKSEATDPKQREYASNLVASGYALTDLLNEVLEAVKVSSGEIPILKKKFNLQKKLNTIIALNQARALHKKIELSLDYDPSIPHYLVGDSARIHRVVLELVTNALNFTHKGCVKLSAQLAKNSGEDVIIKIIVDDTGIGIAPEKQQDIYLQFKRLTPSYEGIYKGHGLGLSIAKQLIDDLKGEIYVESQVGAGSKFTLIVKLRKSLLDEELGSEDVIPLFTGNTFIAPLESKVLESATTEEASQPYKSRILVVEDSPMAAHVVTTMLTSMNCAVDLAGEGKEAVELAEYNPYDLIFMDIGLPDMDGYEVTKRIRLHELKKHHVPIIALTAHASEENKKYCIDIGMNAVLTKPLGYEKAEDILNSFIPYRRDRLNQITTTDSLEEVTSHEELAIFDFELLKEQFRGAEAAVEMVALFLVGLPKDLEEIQAAYIHKDWSAIGRLTHKLKGGVSYCGALRLQESCTQLENAISNGENEFFENLYKRLLAEIKSAEDAMKKEIFPSP